MKKTIILSACLMLGSLVSVSAQTEQKEESKKETPAAESTKLNHNTSRASKGRVKEEKEEAVKVEAEKEIKTTEVKKNPPAKAKLKPEGKSIAPKSGVNAYTPVVKHGKKGRKVAQIK
ncbi:MAG: hypothetical protein ACI9N1_002205 [Flavobacteriales bacterium]|jgi:hypothetical protein